AFDSPNDTANWLTFGIHGTIRESIFPANAWSSEHWANMMGMGGMVIGGGITAKMIKPHNLLTSSGGGIKLDASSRPPGSGPMAGGFNGYKDPLLQVMDNIAESKKARESSKFSEFAEKEKRMVEGTGEPVRRYFRETTQADRELVESLRKKYTAGKKRNVAAAKGKIDGDEIDLESVSGEFTDNDYVNKGNFKPPQPEDYHYQGPISEFTSHTEQKVVEYLRLKYKEKPDVKGKIEIISERPYCDNCIDLVDQFQKEFPNIELVRVEVIPK
ncbi:putative deaminase of polymorphic toxin system, partial [Paenibacillus barcinonensis]